MHEVGITRSLIEIAERHAREQGVAKVVSVTVAIGALSGVVPEAVEFCFEACSRGTFLEGTRLLIERIPGRGRCGACGTEAEIDPHAFACPACGAFALERLQGEELRVTEMEID
jgi:hydrogenase nickel incorporation protein HypA/HybF